jgi:hypothetical protein
MVSVAKAVDALSIVPHNNYFGCGMRRNAVDESVVHGIQILILINLKEDARKVDLACIHDLDCGEYHTLHVQGPVQSK